jgi:membrane associated rhomboid family serine protease
MIVLWSFGKSVEAIFQTMQSYDFISSAYLHLSILVILGIVGSTVSTIFKHKEDRQYSAVGASGLVSAMVFTHIFFQPMEKIYFYFAIPIPGIVFGVLYLIYSSYMAKRNMDNINHQAHIWGALIGFIYPIFMNPKLVSHFIESFKF